MSFTPKTQPFSGKINAVTLGTGDNAIVIGGQNVLPFYTFDAPIENAPKIGVEVSDLASQWETAGLKEYYAGCTTMADYAKKAEAIEGCDFICLNFVGADPNGADRSVADCVADAKAVAEVVTKPIVVMGCKNLEKDGELLAALAEALTGKNVLVMSAKNENYKTVGASVALASGQKVGAETADDINLAKQLNIMMKGLNVNPASIVMDIGTAAVGYGYEYAASLSTTSVWLLCSRAMLTCRCLSWLPFATTPGASRNPPHPLKTSPHGAARKSAPSPWKSLPQQLT